jgi:hypothetical protein
MEVYLSIREIFDVVVAGLMHLARDRADIYFVAGRLKLWSSGLFHDPIAIDEVFRFYQTLGRVHPLRAGILDLFTEILVVTEYEIMGMVLSGPSATPIIDSGLCKEIATILETAELLPTTLEAMAKLCVAEQSFQPEVTTASDSDEASQNKTRSSGSKWASSGISHRTTSARKQTTSKKRPKRDSWTSDEVTSDQRPYSSMRDKIQPEGPTLSDSDDVGQKEYRQPGAKWSKSGIFRRKRLAKLTISNERPKRDPRTAEEVHSDQRPSSGMTDKSFYYLSFCVETLFEILPEVTREQRYFCSTQLRGNPRNPLWKTPVTSAARVSSLGDPRPATLGQQLDKVEELVALHDRAVQDGSKWDPAMRAVRDSVEKNLPREIVDTRVSDLEAARRQNLPHDNLLYSHARSLSHGLSWYPLGSWSCRAMLDLAA